MNPYVFVVGCPRSGTTLLQRMLDAHPKLAVIHETEWIPGWYIRGTGLTAHRTVTHEFVERLYEHRRFTKLNLARSDVEAWLSAHRDVSYSRFVTHLFDLYGRARSKHLVGEKSPRYVRHISVLHSLWPDARFVHLVRDGRDVYLSAAGWTKQPAKRRTSKPTSISRISTWDQDEVATAALWWRWHVRAGREAAAALGPTLYHELRYEDLLLSPEASCGKLCRFLDLPYDGSMLRFHETRSNTEASTDAKHSWSPLTQGLRDWRTELSPDEARLFQIVAGDVLAESGYGTATAHADRAARQYAARVKERFSEDVLSRGHSLPEDW